LRGDFVTTENHLGLLRRVNKASLNLFNSQAVNRGKVLTRQLGLLLEVWHLVNTVYKNVVGFSDKVWGLKKSWSDAPFSEQDFSFLTVTVADGEVRPEL